MKNIVVVSVYDSGYCASFMENGKVNDIDTYRKRINFKERFGEDIDRISIDDLAKFYESDTIIILCVDGGIECVKGNKRK